MVSHRIGDTTSIEGAEEFELEKVSQTVALNKTEQRVNLESQSVEQGFSGSIAEEAINLQVGQLKSSLFQLRFLFKLINILL